MSSLSESLNSIVAHPMVAVFLVMSTGLLVGRIKIRGVSLGMTGIFVSGMLMGLCGITAREEIGTVGIVFLMYGIGLGAGPTFVQALRKFGKPLVVTVASMVLTGAVTAYAFARAADIPRGLAVGVFVGSMKSSSGLAAAIGRLPADTSIIAVGYGVSYPLALLIIVLAVQLLPMLLRKDVAVMNAELEKQRPASQKIGQVMVKVTRPEVVGKKLAELDFVAANNCRILRVLEGDQLVPARPDTVCPAGLHVLVIGTEDRLPAVVAGLGHEIQAGGLVAWDDRMMEVVVTSPNVAGKTLRELNPVVTYGVCVLEVSRFGHSFVPSDDWLLQRMDVLQVRGSDEHAQAFARAAGHHAKALEETDVLSLATGLVLGVLVGLVPIGFGHDALKLGLAGGPMLVALILSHFGRIGGVVGHFPPATQMFLIRFGLALLLSVAAMKAGTEIVAVFSEHGLTILFMSLTINLVALLTGLLVSYVLLRQNFLETLTVLCGGANATPAYEVLAVKADSDIVLAIYTTAYAVTLILIVIATQLLIVALR